MLMIFSFRRNKK